MFSGQVTQSGIKSGYNLSDEAIAALQCGDVQALIDSHRARFGGWSMMADDDGDDDDSDDDDDKNGGDSGSDDDGDDNDDDAGSDDDDDEKVTKADLKRMEKRMKAADKRASDAEARLRKIDDSKKDDLTKANDRVAELEEDNSSKDKTINSLRLENAFLTSNKHTWHKPSAALRLAQAEGYLDDVISDDGTVDSKAMEKALDKVAKENDYLIKRAGGSSGDGGGSGASGGSAGGRSGNKDDKKKLEEEDRRRSPALARRGR